MQVVRWNSLTLDQQQQLLERPTMAQSANLAQQVATIVSAVREQGDAAVLAYTQQFDCQDITQLRVDSSTIAARAALLPGKTKAAIDKAYGTIRAFHAAQQPLDVSVETVPGVICSQRFHPLDAVGLYIPGGSAVLPSTALMLGIPAQLANCRRRVLVSPPDAAGQLSAAIMYVAQLCGITEVYACGGAQAIAALAYGTESMTKVDKIFGPGNSYVTAAKQLVSQDARGAAIDMPAGPSELLIIADETARADFVAADLLSQAEHGADSQVILLTPSATLASNVVAQVQLQLAQLPRAPIATNALVSSSVIVVESLEQAIEISQQYAPEHLSLQLDGADNLLNRLTFAGSIFVGHYTPEAGGDYATGTNHVLPTYGFARNYSSLGLLDFYRRYTVQKASKQGLADLAEAIVELAETEGLAAHARAVTIRLEADA
jgi:histidinol dehydrogenase